MEALKGMPDIEAASTNTVNAWKRLQINTAGQLGKLHAAAGRQEEAQRMEKDAQVTGGAWGGPGAGRHLTLTNWVGLPFPPSQEKMAYLRAQAEMELQGAQQRLEQVQQQADAARQAFALHLDAAAE